MGPNQAIKWGHAGLANSPEFRDWKPVDIDADQIERYLRQRIPRPKRVRTSSGFRELGTVKPTTAHQEFQVLLRIFSVAVKKKLCPGDLVTRSSFQLR